MDIWNIDENQCKGDELRNVSRIYSQEADKWTQVDLVRMKSSVLSFD